MRGEEKRDAKKREIYASPEADASAGFAEYFGLDGPFSTDGLVAA
jgi:hypothetical protein